MISRTVLCYLAAFIGFASLAPSVQKSAGAPPGTTNSLYDSSTREGSCANAGCHTTYAINEGNGTMSITNLDGGSTFMPGSTHRIRVTIADAGFGKFGFQAMAAKTISPAVVLNAGTLGLADDYQLNTQLLDNPATTGNMADRVYVTHTVEGNEPLMVGTQTWEFTWTAPDTLNREVTIYVAGLSANMNGGESGDYVYADSLLLTPPPVGIATSNEVETTLYPTPNNGTFHLTNHQAWTTVTICDLQGRLVWEGKPAAMVNTGLAPGNYVVGLQSEGAVKTFKTIVK